MAAFLRLVDYFRGWFCFAFICCYFFLCIYLAVCCCFGAIFRFGFLVALLVGPVWSVFAALLARLGINFCTLQA